MGWRRTRVAAWGDTMTALALPGFDTTAPAGPRCRMCARPAHWSPSKQRFEIYCTSRACTNRERICQSCAQPFNFGVDGAGTKYCAGCRSAGGNAGTGRSVVPACCAWCGADNPATYRKRPVRSWPYVCARCLNPIKHVVNRLKAHHVSHERVRRLVADPGCEICGTNLLARFKEGRHGQLKALLVVDHDHTCCPAGSHSCGRCIRGLICRGCNSAAGMLLDDPDRAVALAKYLRRVAHG